MKYLGCQGCCNNVTELVIWHTITYCRAGVDNPFQCPLYKRVLNPDIAEFFNATCERYREVKNGQI